MCLSRWVELMIISFLPWGAFCATVWTSEADWSGEGNSIREEKGKGCLLHWIHTCPASICGIMWNMYGHVSKSTGIVDGWNPASPAMWTSDKTCCSLYDPLNFKFDMAGVAGFQLLITSDFTYAGPLQSSKIQGVWRQKLARKVSPISAINSITSCVPLLFLSVSQ